MVRRIATAVAWCGFIAACSDASGTATSAVNAAQACADNARQRCARLQTCSPTDVELRYGSVSTCEARETKNCTTSLAEPLNGNTPAAVEACSGAYADWACVDYLNGVNIPLSCRQQLGPVISGGFCALDGECESGFCAITPGAPCGACTAPPKVGASCARLTSCGAGLTCTPDTATCVPFGVRGSACGKGAVCGVGLSCVGVDVTPNTQGLCQPAGQKVGVPCDPTSRTAAGCDRNAGMVCNTTSNTCQKVVVASLGQPCGNDVGDQLAYCQADGACTGGSSATPGRCTAAAADGAKCDLVAGPACVIPARCIGHGGTSGTCQYSGEQTCRP
jgi:hypothetical protein